MNYENDIYYYQLSYFRRERNEIKNEKKILLGKNHGGIMLNKYKIIIRTLLVYFPILEKARRFYWDILQRILGIPFENCFYAVKLFPELKKAQYLDVGGNIGLGVEAILKYNKNCDIHSFEPNPETFKALYKKLRNNKRVKLYNFGLGDKEGQFELFVPVYRGYVFSGLSSFNENEARTWLSRDNLLSYNEKFLDIKKLVCKIKKLDGLKLNPFFMKLDVEGFEYQVLLGAEETIKRSKPIILIESLNKDDIKMDMLKPLSYKPYKFIANKFILEENGGFNVFIIPDEKMPLIAKSDLQIK